MMIDVDWRQPFIDYIREQKVPTDKNLVEKIIRRAKSYVLVGDKLYRRGASSRVLMKFVPREEGKDILEEIHKGVCGNHASSRTLVSKAFRRAFYWPHLWVMLRNSLEGAKGANIWPSNNTSRPTS
jgi:hypothetical protein